MNAGRALAFVAFVSLALSPVYAQRTGGGSRGTGHASSGPGVVPNPTYQNTPFLRSPSVQHASDERPVEFKSETVLLEVPVIVTDKSGNHVQGLSRTDFEILEAGKEQKISSFEEIQTTRALLSAFPARAGEYRNDGASGDAPRALTIIALDTINTPYLDQIYGRKQLLKYLADNVQVGQSIGLVAITSRGVRVIHNLSSTISQTLEGPTSADTVTKLRADGLTYNNRLVLPAGQYTVRFVVRDNPSGRVGSVTAPLTVD